jgi:hypothetical protein
MDETGILGFVFVLLNLHFCFLLGHDFSRADRTTDKVRALAPAGCFSGFSLTIYLFFAACPAPESLYFSIAYICAAAKAGSLLLFIRHD